jgi:hypothetical protein
MRHWRQVMSVASTYPSLNGATSLQGKFPAAEKKERATVTEGAGDGNRTRVLSLGSLQESGPRPAALRRSPGKAQSQLSRIPRCYFLFALACGTKCSKFSRGHVGYGMARHSQIQISGQDGDRQSYCSWGVRRKTAQGPVKAQLGLTAATAVRGRHVRVSCLRRSKQCRRRQSTYARHDSADSSAVCRPWTNWAAIRPRAQPGPGR